MTTTTANGYSICKLPTLRAIASQRNVEVIGDRRRKATYVAALVAADKIELVSTTDYHPASCHQEDHEWFVRSGGYAESVICGVVERFGEICIAPTITKIGIIFFHPRTGWTVNNRGSVCKCSSRVDAICMAIKLFVTKAPITAQPAWKQYFTL